MFGMGWAEPLLVFVVVLLLFGAKRLPEVAKALGRSLNAFKEGMKQTDEDEKKNNDRET